jgi:hypothetical protein
MQVPRQLESYVTPFHLQEFERFLKLRLHTLNEYSISEYQLSSWDIDSAVHRIIRTRKIPLEFITVKKLLIASFYADNTLMAAFPNILRQLRIAEYWATKLCKYMPEDCAGIIERFLIGHVKMGTDRYLDKVPL